MVQSAVASLTRSMANATPAEILQVLNGVVYDAIRSRMQNDDHVTFTLFRYTPDGRFVFAGAHEDLLIYRRGAEVIDQIRPQGTWIGARPDIRVATVNGVVELAEGDVLLLYTDGVTEARNAAGECFDIHRLREALFEMRDAPVEAIRDHVIGCAERWMHRQDDDVSVVAVRYHGPPPGRP
jgi:sigma-B regulation protein RsbU (phosphoserine phosphatase)